VLAVAHVGGEFRAGYVIFGYIWVIYTHLGCFGAQGEAGGGAMEFATRSRSPGSKLGKRCQLGLGLGIPPGLVFLGKKCIL